MEPLGLRPSGAIFFPLESYGEPPVPHSLEDIRMTKVNGKLSVTLSLPDESNGFGIENESQAYHISAIHESLGSKREQT